MKIFLILVVVLTSLFTVYLFVLGQNSRSGEAHGVNQGMLGPCPDTPNCVSSERPQDLDHYIEPIDINGRSLSASMQALQEIILAQGGKIELVRSNYIAATFTSPLFGFVDDLEVRASPAAGVIHLRSASRVGSSDLDANRKRVELIRQNFLEY